MGLLKGTGSAGTNKVNYIHCPNPQCKGKGEYYQWVSETKQSMLPCETCHGDLKIEQRRRRALAAAFPACSACNGTGTTAGYFGSRRCSACFATGHVRSCC